MQTKELERAEGLKFSVIMPCYNSASYIRNAINSITEQTYPDWELIAINDGSTDSTLSMLEEYAEKDSRIKVFSKENGGYVSAVNVGLEKISGDYFLLMGSDDALDPNLFFRLWQHVERKQPDCIAFRTFLVRDGKVQGNDQVTSFQSEETRFDMTLAEFIRDCPVHAAIFSVRDTSKCYKRSLLGDLRYFGKYGLDADGIFSMLLCHKARSFSCIPVDGYYWTLRGDSLSGRKTTFLQDLDRVENWNAFYSRVLELETEEITKTEKEYLYYVLEAVRNTWRSSRPLFCAYSTVRNAVGLICKLSEKAEYPLSLSAETRLMIRLPGLWKLYDLSAGKWIRKLRKQA